LDVYHTICGLSANLESAARGRLKYRMQKLCKTSPSAHHRTDLSGYIFTTRARISNRKKLLNSNIYSTFPYNMVNFGPLTADIGSAVWGTTTNFNGFWVSGFVTAPTSLTAVEVNQTARCLAVSWADTLYIHYILPPNGILPDAKLLAALLHGARAVGVSKNLRRIFTRQGGHSIRHWAVDLCSCS